MIQKKRAVIVKSSKKCYINYIVKFGNSGLSNATQLSWWIQLQWDSEVVSVVQSYPITFKSRMGIVRKKTV